MTAAIDISNEVDEATILSNGDIVRFAFNLVDSGFYCGCPWSRNKNEFATLLKNYVYTKYLSRRFGDRTDLQLREKLRRKLGLIWPCRRCFVRFNPTGRKRR